MPELEEIVNKEIPLEELISAPLKKLLSKSEFEFEVVNDESDILGEIDLLIEDVFPLSEAEEYKPSLILLNEANSLCIACLKNKVPQGSITAIFDFENNDVVLVSLAVDKQFRNQKIGSMLMLLLHEICCKLHFTSISLISSSYAKAFYRSFGFAEKALNSFESSIPFQEDVITKKISEKSLPAPEKRTKKRSYQEFLNHNFFNSKETEDNHLPEAKRQHIFTNLSPNGVSEHQP